MNANDKIGIIEKINDARRDAKAIVARIDAIADAVLDPGHEENKPVPPKPKAPASSSDKSKVARQHRMLDSECRPRVLAVVRSKHGSGGVTVPEICEMTGLKKSTVSRILREGTDTFAHGEMLGHCRLWILGTRVKQTHLPNGVMIASVARQQNGTVPTTSHDDTVINGDARAYGHGSME